MHTLCKQSIQEWSVSKASSVVVSLANYLLGSGLQQDGVLILGSVGALDVTQRRVGVHNACIT